MAVRTLLTSVVAVASALGTLLLASLALPVLAEPAVLVPVGVAVLGNAILAGVLGSYDLSRAGHWAVLVLDHSWSLPSTVLGAVVGNTAYLFFGTPSAAESAGRTWIVYRPKSTSGFGTNVLQTLGTVNLGGAGQHERMHLLQARLFGPAYLPLFGAQYVVTGLLQLLFAPVGALLVLLKVRTSWYLKPPASSAVGGFFGWIYYATPFELWAYASGNP